MTFAIIVVAVVLVVAGILLLADHDDPGGAW